MLFLGSCNTCCVDPPEPAQFRAHFYAAKSRGRAVRNTSSGASEYGEKNTLYAYESLCHSWETGGGADCLVSCPEGYRANNFTVPNLTAPADDWAAMQTDVWDDVTPGATDKQDTAANWLYSPMFVQWEPAWRCFGGFQYNCAGLQSRQQMNVWRVAYTVQYRTPPQPFSFAPAYLMTEAKVSSAISFLYWPLDPSESMQSQHGIYDFKVYYQTATWRPNPSFVRTPIGAYVNKIVQNPTTCTTSSFTLGTSIDVQYGFVGTPSVSYHEDALQAMLDGTALTDGSLSPDSSNTAKNSTFTAGTADTASTDPNNIYWLGFAVSSPKYPSDPFTIAHPGVPSPNFWQYSTARPGRIYTYWGIEDFTMCYIYKIEARDSGGSVIETYNF